MAEINLNIENFDSEVLGADKPVLVDFWADWCGPCKMQGGVLKEFAEAHPEYKICKVNVDDEPVLSDRFNVTSIPMLAVFKDGKQVKSVVGLQGTKALESLMQF